MISLMRVYEKSDYIEMQNLTIIKREITGG
jgi:hypothetical protein